MPPPFYICGWGNMVTQAFDPFAIWLWDARMGAPWPDTTGFANQNKRLEE